MADDIPQLTEGYLGPQGKFGPYGLVTLTHPDPLLRMSTNKVLIIIGTSEKTRFTIKFKRMNPIQEMNNCVLMQNLQDQHECHFDIAVCQPGFYKFEIYAIPSSEAGPHFINVYNYLLDVRNVDAYVEPYPKQYPAWKQSGCFVKEPKMLQKGVNYPVTFTYDIPKAIDVQVKAGDDWHQLQKVEPGKSIYQGYIDFSQQSYPPGTKVKLMVKTGRNNKYDILLEYTI